MVQKPPCPTIAISSTAAKPQRHAITMMPRPTRNTVSIRLNSASSGSSIVSSSSQPRKPAKSSTTPSAMCAMPGSISVLSRQFSSGRSGISSAAARTSNGCSQAQSNTSGAISAVNTPPSAPPADMTR
jgi:hypothetical protein